MKSQQGFTLIELLVAVSIFVVLMLAATILYTTSLKTYVKDKATQDLQREGDAILSSMSRNLKEAVSVDTANSNFTSNPNTLVVNLATSGQKRRYYVTGNQLHYVDENNNDIDLLSPGSTDISLTFSPSSDTTGNLTSITIRSTLQRTRYGITTTLAIGSTIAARPQ